MRTIFWITGPISTPILPAGRRTDILRHRTGEDTFEGEGKGRVAAHCGADPADRGPFCGGEAGIRGAGICYPPGRRSRRDRDLVPDVQRAGGGGALHSAGAGRDRPVRAGHRPVDGAGGRRTGADPGDRRDCLLALPPGHRRVSALSAGPGPFPAGGRADRLRRDGGGQ